MPNNACFSRWYLSLGVYILLLLLAVRADAARIYTSRDAKGNLVFSDIPVAGTKLMRVRRIEVAKGPCCAVQKRGGDDDLWLIGVNECFGPVEFSFDLEEAQNVALNRPRSFTALVSARGEQKLVHLWRSNPRLGYHYRFTRRLVIGDPAARHLPPQPYLLPVPPAKRFYVSQAFGGAATHHDLQNYYAVDIPMPEGTPVYAARGGVIMEVANDFLRSGIGSRFEERANYIRILHDDGTMAIYAHLMPESIRYPTGTRVRRGDCIAESGNTGYSSGPHLHFAVQKNFGMELRSVPFQFIDATGRPFTPEQGMAIYRRIAATGGVVSQGQP